MADHHQIRDVKTDLGEAFCSVTNVGFFFFFFLRATERNLFLGGVNFAKYGTFKILKAPPLQAVVVPRLTTKCLYSYKKLIKNETLLK